MTQLVQATGNDYIFPGSSQDRIASAHSLWPHGTVHRRHIRTAVEIQLHVAARAKHEMKVLRQQAGHFIVMVVHED